MEKTLYFINKIMKFTYIYNIHVDDFLKFKSPCSECYLQTMCLIVSKPYYDLYSSVLIRSCERLENYISNSEYFEELDKESQIAIAISHYETRTQ